MVDYSNPCLQSLIEKYGITRYNNANPKAIEHKLEVVLFRQVCKSKKKDFFQADCFISSELYFYENHGI